MNIIQVSGDVMYPYKQIHPVPKGQVRFSKIKFNFSDDWENREVIVQFVQGDKTPINKPIESDGTCFVPDSIDLGMLFVYLRGYSGDGTSIATSNGVKIPIVQGPFDGGEPEVPPSPDLYSQLVNQVSQYAEEAKSSADRAEDAAVNSPKIGNNGNWFVWDFEAGKYVDTGVPASGGGSGAVTSINGKTGAVELTAGDVGAVSAPATASIGQTIRVKAVDDAGKPTEWEAADVTAGGDEYSPTLPLVVSITLTEEVSMIEITTDKEGNPLSLEEMDIVMNLFGGEGNVNRDASVMYFNGKSTAVGRLNLELNIGEAGKQLISSQYIAKREYGHRVIGQYGYGASATSNSYKAVNRFMYINSAEEDKISKYPKFTQINLYPVTEGYTFGAGTKIDIFGR